MREIFVNEIDFDKAEVRLIKLNPIFIVGIREKFVRVDPTANGLGDMDCTVIDYNGREILVVEKFRDVVQAVAFEDAYNFYHDNAKYHLPDALRRLSKQLKFIQDSVQVVGEQVDSSDQPSPEDIPDR
jgi:hypothetical protein